MKRWEVFLWDVPCLLAISVIHTVRQEKKFSCQMQRSPNMKKTKTTGGMQCAVQEKTLWEMKALAFFFFLFFFQKQPRIKLCVWKFNKVIIPNGRFQVVDSVISGCNLFSSSAGWLKYWNSEFMAGSIFMRVYKILKQICKDVNTKSVLQYLTSTRLQ